jgi:hypothetical protein
MLSLGHSRIHEAALGEAACQRRLSALKAGHGLAVAGAGLLTLMAARRSAATSGAGTTTHTLALRGEEGSASLLGLLTRSKRPCSQLNALRVGCALAAADVSSSRLPWNESRTAIYAALCRSSHPVMLRLVSLRLSPLGAGWWHNSRAASLALLCFTLPPFARLTFFVGMAGLSAPSFTGPEARADDALLAYLRSTCACACREEEAPAWAMTARGAEAARRAPALRLQPTLSRAKAAPRVLADMAREGWRDAGGSEDEASVTRRRRLAVRREKARLAQFLRRWPTSPRAAELSHAKLHPSRCCTAPQAHEYPHSS